MRRLGRRLGIHRSAAGRDAPPWCGAKKITLGLTDGFGGNSWRLVTTASAKDEIAKCPSVTDFEYADGQGNTQKAISDIQGLVAKGVERARRLPRRRQRDPAGAAQCLRGRRDDGALPREPRR